ncbi:MAG: hypothetical protein JF591_20150 [Lysobacter sp.]|nr:hypothetical protein [Lysobacter sp.]
MTRDDRVITWAIAITFVLSALAMAGIVVKSQALHDRFFMADEPAAASVRAADGSTAVSPGPRSRHRPIDTAAMTPFAHYWSSAQRSHHRVVPDSAVIELANDERALSFETDHRRRDGR